MRENMRCRHDEEIRLRAADLIERGFGKYFLASTLAIPRQTAEKWILTYKAIGLDGLLNMGSRHREYSPETKLAAVLDFLEGKMTKQEVMAKHAIASVSPLEKWVRDYRESGPGALQPKPRGRPKGSAACAAPKTREQELEARVRKLEAENAYLKKVRALEAEKSRAGRSPR